MSHTGPVSEALLAIGYVTRWLRSKGAGSPSWQTRGERAAPREPSAEQPPHGARWLRAVPPLVARSAGDWPRVERYAMVGIERRVSSIFEEILDDVSHRDEPGANDVLGRLAS